MVFTVDDIILKVESMCAHLCLHANNRTDLGQFLLSMLMKNIGWKRHSNARKQISNHWYSIECGSRRRRVELRNRKRKEIDIEHWHALTNCEAVNNQAENSGGRRRVTRFVWTLFCWFVFSPAQIHVYSEGQRTKQAQFSLALIPKYPLKPIAFGHS